MELQGRLEEIRKEGLSLAAISYDPVPVLADFARRRHITFPLLSDTGSATIKTYGILNTTDNKICFTPQSVPLAWNVAWKPLDRDGTNPRRSVRLEADGSFSSRSVRL